MKNLSKFTAFLMIVGILSVNLAFAAPSEKRIDISKKSYVTVTNVTSSQEVDSDWILTANSPVKITFNGDNLAWEEISYSKTVEQEDPSDITFDVKKYTLPYSDDTTKVYDERIEKSDDIPLYVSGNYATLTAPGYYYVIVGPEAVSPTVIIINIVGNTSSVTPPSAPKTASASATSSKVLVNGKAVSFEAYAINGNNYFKLRDVAMAINNTDKNFEVSWDGAKNAINLISSKPYTVAGGELKVSGKKTSQTATLSTSKIYMDGEEISLTAYTIGGSNYFKLRDLANVIDFGVVWDGNTNTIGIDTSIEYND